MPFAKGQSLFSIMILLLVLTNLLSFVEMYRTKEQLSQTRLEIIDSRNEVLKNRELSAQIHKDITEIKDLLNGTN